MAHVRELIANLIAGSNLNLAELSRRIGKNHAYLQQYLQRGVPQKLNEDVREALARELGISPDELRETPSSTGRVATQQGTLKPLALSVPKRAPTGQTSHDTFKPKDFPLSDGNTQMPLYRFAHGGKGSPILEGQPFEQVTRPEYLAKVRDPYGVMVEGDSMVPEYHPGWIAHVDPHLTARPGDTCIFRGEQEDGTQIACIKVLRRETETLWYVEQHNPPRGEKKAFSLKKAEYQVAHVTTGTDRRRR